MGLRVKAFSIPSWRDGLTKMREPRVVDFIAARKIPDEQERTISLLGSMVLGDDGQPVGAEAILEASVSAFREFAAFVPEMLGGDAADSPLDQKSDSPTG